MVNYLSLYVKRPTLYELKHKLIIILKKCEIFVTVWKQTKSKNMHEWTLK